MENSLFSPNLSALCNYNPNPIERACENNVSWICELNLHEDKSQHSHINEISSRLNSWHKQMWKSIVMAKAKNHDDEAIDKVKSSERKGKYIKILKIMSLNDYVI